MTMGAIGNVSLVLLAAALSCGCANSGFDLSTASVTPEKTAAVTKPDPICVALASQISTIKGDGSIERLEKAAAGKGAKVEVKRAALQKQAELNKANADFQTRCGPAIPNQAAAQQPSQAQASAKSPATASDSKTQPN